MLLVLGYHHSGTSLLTKYLILSGLTPPSDTLKFGTWESESFTKLNDNILQFNGMKWHDTHINTLLQLNKKLSHEVQNFVNINLNVELLKDPRVCITWPIWAEYYPNFKFIITIRNPYDCARSLLEKNCNPNSLVENWCHYYTNIKNFLISRDYPKRGSIPYIIFGGGSTIDDYYSDLSRALSLWNIEIQSTTFLKAFDETKVHFNEKVEWKHEDCYRLYKQIIGREPLL